ncbi:MAG: ABC transporter permease [Bacillota bacterium]|nr:ABC transporter permease [Bacillota bacterium]
MSVEAPLERDDRPRLQDWAWPRPTRGALMVWLRDWTAWRKFYVSSLLAHFGEPVLSLLALGLGLGLYVTRIQGMSFVEFMGPGLVASTAMNAVSFDLVWGGYDRLHWTRAYDAMMASPLAPEEIAAGELLWQATRAVLYGGFFLLVLAVFGLVRSWTALGVLPVLALTGVVFGGPALAVASLARAEEQLSYYFSLVIQPMFLFSGIFFPVERLGPVLRTAAEFLPLYHVVRLSRALVTGAWRPEMAWSLLVLATFAALAALLPVGFFRKALERIA